MSVSVSFVVPTWNDTSRLSGALECLDGLDPKPEIVVADASEDREPVRELVEKFDAIYVEVSEPGRGGQLDAGARLASGDTLVFHHADTKFNQAHYEALVGALEAEADLVGGAFYKDIRSHHPKVAWSEPVVRLYSRYVGVMYGDQSVFVRRVHYEELGGFRVIPLMEDVDFSKRLRRSGRVTLLDPPIQTSMRKFRAEGTLWRKVQNVTLVFLFRIGVSPERLHSWYYKWKKAGRGAG